MAVMLSWPYVPMDKWLPFLRRQFQVNFHELKILCFDSNFTKFGPKGPIDNKSPMVQVMA